MYRIIEGRGTGKTSRLMLLAKENNAIFVCSNPSAMEYKAKQYGIDGIKFISYWDFITHDGDYDENGTYIIDELECLINDAFFPYNKNAKLIGYSLSLE